MSVRYKWLIAPNPNSHFRASTLTKDPKHTHRKGSDQPWGVRDTNGEDASYRFSSGALALDSQVQMATDVAFKQIYSKTKHTSKTEIMVFDNDTGTIERIRSGTHDSHLVCDKLGEM